MAQEHTCDTCGHEPKHNDCHCSECFDKNFEKGYQQGKNEAIKEMERYS